MDIQSCNLIRPFLVLDTGFYHEVIITGRHIAEGNVIGIRHRIPCIFQSFQHIGILHLIDQCIVAYIKSYIKAILHILQPYFRLTVNTDHLFIVSRITQRSKYLHFRNNSRRRLTLCQNKIRIKAAKSIDGTEINLSILILSYTATHKISHRHIIPMVIVIENILIPQQTTDSFIGAHPDIMVGIFRYSTYMCIGQSFFTAVNLIFPIGWRGETHQTFSCPDPYILPAVFINCIDGIGREQVLHIKELDILQFIVSYPQTAPKRAYPQTSLRVLHNAPHQIILELIMSHDLLISQTNLVDTTTGTNPQNMPIVFIERTDILIL